MSQDAPATGDSSGPEETREREQLAVELARRYYVDQVSTPELALEFGVSRSTISRLISLARDLGCVQIEVRDPQHHPNSISQLISDKYGLSQITAVTNKPGITSGAASIHHEVARRAAADVKGLIYDGITVGIAWGSTIAAVSEHLTVAAVSQTAVVQLFGAGSPLHIELDSAGEVLGRFTHAWNASAVWFSVPAFFDHAETRTALWKERSVQRVLEIQRECDMAIFSVGSTTAESPSRILAAGYLNEADVAMLVEDKAIGDISSYFFDEDGNPDNIRINDRASGLPLEALRAIPTRLCVASGHSKAAAVLAALRGGYVSHLVADTALLRRIVELDDL